MTQNYGLLFAHQFVENLKRCLLLKKVFQSGEE
jgi:hypothetical protein